MALQPTYNPYVSQYVAPPVEEYAQTAQYFQKEYDENMLASEKLKTMMNSVKTLPGDKLRLANQLKQYEDRLGQLSKDGNWEDSSLKVRNLATDFTGNYQAGEIGQLANSYTNYQQYIGDKQKLGNEYAAYNDPFLRYQAGGNENQDGSYRGFTYGGMGKREDHYKKADEIVGKIAEDETIRAGMTPLADGTGYTFSKNGSGGVSARKVQDVAAAKATAFMRTIEGGDYIKMLTYQAGRKLSAQEQYDASKDYLVQAAYNQIGIKTSNDVKLQIIPEWLRKEQKDEADTPELNATTSYANASGNPAATDVADVMDNYEVGADGKLIQLTKEHNYTQEEMAAFAGAGVQGDLTNNVIRRAVPASDVVGNNLQKTLDDLERVHMTSGARRPISKQDLYKHYRASLKKMENVFPDTKDFTPATQKAKTDQLAPNGDPYTLFSGRQIVELDVKGKGGVPHQGIAALVASRPEIEALLNNPKTKVSIKGRSLTNPYGMPGAYTVSLTSHGAKGVVVNKEFLVSASPEEAGASGILGELSAAKYSGKPSTDIMLPTQQDGKVRYLRVNNNPNGGNGFLQTVQMRERTGSGADQLDKIISTESLENAIQDTYKKVVVPELKKFRLGSSSQTKDKGEYYNNNDDNESDDE